MTSKWHCKSRKSACVLSGVTFALVCSNGTYAQGRDDWSERITISGAMEVNASMGSNLAGGSSGDITLDTVELGIDAAVTESVTGHLLILHEDDATEPWEVDEGTIDIDYDVLNFSAGRMYLPFGTFETHLVSDPLTLELGETREAALQLSMDWEGFYGAFYIYNGDLNTAEAVAAGDDSIDQLGFSVGFDGELLGLNINTGFDFISNIADSNTIQELVITAPQVDAYVAGWAIHANVTWDPITLIFEYVAAGEFLVGEVPFAGAGAVPSALHLEAAVGFSVFDTNMTFAVAYQSTAEASALDLPESKLLIGMGVELDENVSLKGEFAHVADYAVEDGGSGEAASVITGQLAIGF